MLRGCILRLLWLWLGLTPLVSIATSEDPWGTVRGLPDSALLERVGADSSATDFQKARALLTLADRALHQSTEAVGQYLRQAEALPTLDQEATVVAAALRCQLEHRQSLPEATRSCGDLLEIDVDAHSEFVQAFYVTTLMYYFYREGDHTRSQTEAERALILAAAVDDAALMAATHNMLGLHFVTRLRPRMSLPHFESALEAARELPFSGPMVITQLNLASSYTYLGRGREALAMLQEARDSPVVDLYPTRQLVVQSMIGQARAALGETDGAQRELKQAIERAKEQVLPDGMTYAYTGLGIIQLTDKQPNDALANFQKVLDITGQDFSTGLQHSRIQLVAVPFAQALRESGDPLAALQLLKRLIASIPPDKPDQLLLDAYRQLALTYKATGDPQGAKQAQEEAASIESRLWDASFQYQLARLNASLEIDRRTFELERSREREAALREKAERETTLRRQTWLIGGMLFALIALLFSRRLQKRTADAERVANARLEDDVKARTRELEDEMAKRMAAEVEKRQLSETMLEGEKLRSMGQLTAGIAHDFNNLMTVVTLGADQLSNRFRGDVEASETLAHIKNAADTGAKITRGLLAYVRKQPLDPELIRLDHFLNEALPIWRNTLGERITLTTHFEPCVTRVDKGQLTTAVLNLLLNAREAMLGGGTVSITLRSVTDARQQSRAEIVVQDNGVGMTQAVREQAVEPFFTTKEGGEGSGLGLSMVFGFARQSDGDLTIKSERNKGTTITLSLPVATTQARSETPSSTASRLIPAGTRVLAVEDRAELLHVLEPALTQLGVEVTTANNAMDALHKIETGSLPDLVITDIVMPGKLDGLELVKKLRQLSPELPVVLMSGYSKSVGHDCTFLRKPFSVSELEGAIEKTLNKRRTASVAT